MFPVSDVIPPRRRPIVTLALIAVHVVAWMRQVQLEAAPEYLIAGPLLTGPAPAGWSAPLAPLTALFLHEGWPHLGVNMLFLWIFGANVEDSLGRLPYLAFYLLSSTAVSMAYAASEPLRHAEFLGSTGAVAAVLGAYFALYPRSQVLTVFFAVVYFDVVEVPAIFFLGLWLFFQVVIGVPVAVPPAGFVIGMVVGLLARRRSRWSRG